jgi:GGDEF domain-containing protein
MSSTRRTSPGWAGEERLAWRGDVPRKNGETFPAWEHICLVSYDLELPAHYIIGCTDVSSIKKAEIELNRMAFHDALTDLGNRHLLNEQLAIELTRAGDGSQMGLVFIDLDGFKLINDGMGHATGDQLLWWWHSASAKPSAAPTFRCALAGTSSSSSARTAASRTAPPWPPPAGKTGTAMPAGKDNIVVTASIGIALYPQHGTSAEKLLSAADSAMYQAKQAGKRRYCTFNESMAEKVHERLRLEQRLRHAVKTRSFTLHYQPLIRVEDNVLIGFEALLRWQDEGEHPAGRVHPGGRRMRIDSGAGQLGIAAGLYRGQALECQPLPAQGSGQCVGHAVYRTGFPPACGPGAERQRSGPASAGAGNHRKRAAIAGKQQTHPERPQTDRRIGRH